MTDAPKTMRERLVAALRDALCDEGNLGPEPHIAMVNGFVDLAEAVDAILAELREPDEAMRSAGFDGHQASGRENIGIEETPTGEGCGVIFTAMIDAIREMKT